ncbi:serine hydrolase domain-containing protein [Pararhodobacter marinus]|uniref:serine hydrolase domain-containing protein n=1 Tax=Pararhodobacter marinus TaxID=2184063 RepID=UPI003512F768
MSIRFWALLTLMLGGGTLVAQAQDTMPEQAAAEAAESGEAPAAISPAEALARAFFDWAHEQGAAAPEIAVTYRGAVVLTQAEGVEPGAPRELASMSKAITAQCLAGLVEEGRLRWSDTMAARLGWTGAPGAITVAQLVTHSAGLPDRTQEAMPGWLTEGDWRSVAEWPMADLIPTADDTPPAYRYSNENYALLGSVVEAVTGQPYGVACDGVLPAASISETTGAFGPMGGWQAPLADYAMFHAMLYGDRPAQGPATVISAPVVYGLGMVGRPLGEDWIWWHNGMLCMEDVQAAAYSVLWRGGWGVTVAVDSCPGWEGLEALDLALVEALPDE